MLKGKHQRKQRDPSFSTVFSFFNFFVIVGRETCLSMVVLATSYLEKSFRNLATFN